MAWLLIAEIIAIPMNMMKVERNSDHIFGNIINSAMKLKKNCEVSMSTITERNDQYQRKIAGANRKTKKRSCEKNLQFLNQRGTITIRHLSRSRFHPNNEILKFYLMSLLKLI